MMLEGRHVDAEGLETSALGVEILPVDLEREMVERRSLELHWLARIVRKQNGQRLVKAADDLRVAAARADSSPRARDYHPDFAR